MAKPISTKVHGIVDYVSAAALVILPRVLGWNRTTTRLLTSAAASTVAYSLLTDYELGVFKVLPMKAHLAMDGVQSALTATAPFVFNIGKREETAGLLGISLFETLIVLNSQSRVRRSLLDRIKRGLRRS